MSESNVGAERRLQRLERVLAGRRARLARALAGQQRRAAPRQLGGLQRHGYSAALLIALAAVLPTALGFALRRRKLLFGVAANSLGIRKLRKRYEAARRAETSR